MIEALNSYQESPAEVRIVYSLALDAVKMRLFPAFSTENAGELAALSLCIGGSGGLGPHVLARGAESVLRPVVTAIVVYDSNGCRFIMDECRVSEEST